MSMMNYGNNGMLNRQQDMQPYAYNMTNNLPRPSGVPNGAIPSLAPSMQTPLLNAQSFMPSGPQQTQATYAQGGQANMGMYEMAQRMNNQGQNGFNEMSPEEEEWLAQFAGNMAPQHSALPHYKRGGPLKKLAKFAKKAAGPVVGSVVGGMLGGPAGASIGGALGGGLTGGKNKLTYAALGGLGGYAGAGGFGPMGGFGSILPNVGKGIGGIGGTGAGAGALGTAGKVGAAANLAKDMAGQKGVEQATDTGGISGMMSSAFPWLMGGALVGTLAGKRKVPNEESLESHIAGRGSMWGPEHQARNVKPLNRKLRELREREPFSPEELYYEQVNPETEYAAAGGGMYLDGHTGGQDDKIPAALSDGEYVLSADIVSSLGDGNNNAGAKKLDAFMRKVRTHRGKNGTKLPPKSKGIEGYLRGAK